jgi:hypothetical protein
MASTFLTAAFLACQDSTPNLTTPDVPGPRFAKVKDCDGPDPHPSCKDGDDGGGSTARAVVLSGGYTTSRVGVGPQSPIEFKETGKEVQIHTPFTQDGVADLIDYDFSVGAPGNNRIPLSGDIDFNNECRWSGNVTDAGEAATFWDDFLNTHAVAPNFASFLGRRFNVTIFKKSGTGKTGGRWFTWDDADRTIGDKQMWSLSVSSDDELGVTTTGSWDGDTETTSVSSGSIALGWNDCADNPDPDGCAGPGSPAGGDTFKSVVCKNDGAAFPAVTFTAELQ